MPYNRHVKLFYYWPLCYLLCSFYN